MLLRQCCGLAMGRWRQPAVPAGGGPVFPRTRSSGAGAGAATGAAGTGSAVGARAGAAAGGGAGAATGAQGRRRSRRRLRSRSSHRSRSRHRHPQPEQCKPLAVQRQPPWLRPVRRQPLQQQPPQQPPAPPLPLAGRNRPRTAASTALRCRPGNRNTASWSSCRRCVSAGQLAGQLPCVLPQGIQLLALLPQALVTGGLAMFCAFDAPSNPHRKPCFACCDVGHFVIQPKKRPPAAKASSATVVHRVRMVFSGWISSEEEEVARSAE